MARNKFDVDEELEQEFSWKDFKRLARYVVPYKASIGKVLFTIILANLAGMLAPVFTKIAIDSAIPDQNKMQLFLIGAAFVVTLLIIGLCMRYRIYHILSLIHISEPTRH